MSPKENSNWGTRNARVAEKQRNDPNRSKQVAAYNKDGVLAMVFPSTAEAGRNGFTQSIVARCCNGQRQSHKGYQWQYFVDAPPMFIDVA